MREGLAGREGPAASLAPEHKECDDCGGEHDDDGEHNGDHDGEDESVLLFDHIKSFQSPHSPWAGHVSG